MHGHALQAMERILLLESIACQESALHGLGHWQRQCPDAVTVIIDRFLKNATGRDPRLVAYAKSARCGCVL
jgi:hypothetical protein